MKVIKGDMGFILNLVSDIEKMYPKIEFHMHILD